MKALLIKLGLAMASLTFASCLWEKYDYNSLVIKPVAVFFIWIFVTFSLRHLFKSIFTFTEPEEEVLETDDIRNSQPPASA
jgi:hypothetical protein